VRHTKLAIRRLFGTRKYSVSYRIVSYHIRSDDVRTISEDGHPRFCAVLGHQQVGFRMEIFRAIPTNDIDFSDCIK